jgi:uncharacterized membrane protein
VKDVRVFGDSVLRLVNLYSGSIGHLWQLPGSAIQTIYIYAQKKEQQKILYTHRHWDIRRICRALLGTILNACAPSSTALEWDIYN